MDTARGSAGRSRTSNLCEDDAALVARARTYPYDIPDSSFAFAFGDALPLVTVDLKSPLESEIRENGGVSTLRSWAERRGHPIPAVDEHAEPLLAFGSNASIEALTRKFAIGGELPLLPVARATLADFDIVYSSHIARYGAIPAAIQYCPGAVAPVSVLLASPAQRRMLRVTEPNYILAALHEIDLRLEDGQRLTTVPVVLSRHHMLNIDGSEVALAGRQTANRRFPAMTQDEVLQAVCDSVAPGVDVDEFILQNVRDQELAESRTARLRCNAMKFSYSHFDSLS